MKKEIKKNNKKAVDTFSYLKKVKFIGIFGIFFSIALIIYDVYNYSNWVSILSLVVDGLLLIFSIYFIIKSIKLTKHEKATIEKLEKKKKTVNKKR